MNKQFSAGELAFRDEVRAFLRDQLPADISHKVGNDLHLGREDHVRWQKIQSFAWRMGPGGRTAQCW